MMQKFVQRVKNIFQTEEQIVLETPIETVARFILMYQNLHIGTLEFDKGVWIFSYSDTFREQKTEKKVKPIVNFPDTTRTYKSSELWPFFTTRIPGLTQPQVQEIVKREHIDIHNTVELLQRFGRETITNPFLLTQMGVAA
jgi:HipA-like protein